MLSRFSFAGVAAAVAVAGMSVPGCTTRPDRLAEVPNIYAGGRNYLAERVPRVYRTVTPQVLYVTDRSQDLREDGEVVYLAERSDSMSYGTATIAFRGVESWDALLAQTNAGIGTRPGRLDVASFSDRIRFSKTPLVSERRDGRLQTEANAQREYDLYADQFRAAITEQVRQSGTGNILIYVHGFNNGFEDALTTLTNVWHYSGRQSIPLAFSWPAGNSGVFKYFKDRESGEFSVFHFKELLDFLASVPEVDQIDIVAHSRGTDVVTSALRELVIRERGRGNKPKVTMKTGTLILAAPDLDVGTVRQRLISERFAEAFEQVNVYINPKDQALAYSSLLTQEARFGRLNTSDFAPGELAALSKVGLVHFIRVEGVGGLGHSYFRDNPGVMSDIALALRTRAFPGGTLRPLEQDQDNIWRLHGDYPLERLPDLALEYPGEDR
ncbi:alpha/beta hydrolase [Ruegeria sp. HKCCD8929]|uniref:alpha/beta hydrolase n=1 Tax=Ruegeria sp. HKCCD8929 TaxID=2683006 RepID=UPI0014896018|nr:alpha/beta hydrolase [Ruegeria sp. HKCCD8929]